MCRGKISPPGEAIRTHFERCRQSGDWIILNLPTIFSLIKKYHVLPKKRLGQNFLIAPPTLEKIVTHFDLKKNDAVIEVGAGLGLMTAMIALHCAKVIAVERDETLLDIARQEFGHITNITWVHGDILDFDFLAEPLFSKVVGNIPYEITSPLLVKLLDAGSIVQSACLLMQKEVAERICAKPNTKSYGILSVLLQQEAICEHSFDVSATNFFPQPRVTSSLLRLFFRAQKNENMNDKHWFRDVVRAAFGKRRKTLRNSLLGSSLNLTPHELDASLMACGLDGRRRPESLSGDEFALLAHTLSSSPKPR